MIGAESKDPEDF